MGLPRLPGRVGDLAQLKKTTREFDPLRHYQNESSRSRRGSSQGKSHVAIAHSNQQIVEDNILGGYPGLGQFWDRMSGTNCFANNSLLNIVDTDVELAFYSIWNLIGRQPVVNIK